MRYHANMSILVTGGAGFIGSHCIEKLLESTDRPVVCLDSFNDYYDPDAKRQNIRGLAEHPQVKVIEADFCNAEMMVELFADLAVRQVIHLGAYAGVRPSMVRPLLYERNNVRGTLSLLQAAQEHPVERFLLASSSTVYGHGAKPPFREDERLGIPLSPYGATKQAAEILGRTYWKLHGVPVVILRPFSVYGPRVRPDLAMTVFADAIQAGREFPLFGDGSIRRDFTHVSDICDGLLAALTTPGIVGESINLGHSKPIEIRQLICMLEEAIGKPAKIAYQPENAGDMPITHADLTKATRLLAYEPKVQFADGVPEFVDWFLGGRAPGSNS